MNIKKADNPVKKTYETPRLTIYGDLAQLTASAGNGPRSDSGNNRMSVT